MSVRQREKNNIQTKYAALQLLALAYELRYTTYLLSCRQISFRHLGRGVGGRGTDWSRKKNFTQIFREGQVEILKAIEIHTV